MRALLGLLLLLAPAAAENVLLVVIDDVGVDRIGAYRAHPDPGRTPTIDALAARGVLFRSAWSSPACSPTRAGLLTGRYGFRTGIGSVVQPSSGVGLRLAETTIPEALPSEWTSVALGKWHLGTTAQGNLHPERSGFRVFAGTRSNVGNYTAWNKLVHGVITPHTGYIVTDTTDDAIRALRALPEPWFLYVAYHGAHTPTHAPPAHLHSYDLPADPESDVPLTTRAMIEALDTEIGRLLQHVDEADTTVILLGDNGTMGAAKDAPSDPSKAKGSLYEGGVHVPLVVAGPRVARPGSECAGLVGAVDLFATVVEIAGGISAAEDSVSLLPYLADPGRPSLRRTVYTERFVPNGSWNFIYRSALREERFKLHLDRISGEEQLFDLASDPAEERDLLLAPVLAADARAAYERLRREIDELVGG